MASYRGESALLAALPIILLLSFFFFRQPLADKFGWSFLEPAAVHYEPGLQLPVEVPAGKVSPVELRFMVDNGQYVVARAGRNRTPVALSIPDSSEVWLENVDYPDGTEITLPGQPGTTLDAYDTFFGIKAYIVSKPGRHRIFAKLAFQPCDRNSCESPQSIWVPFNVIGK